jgi:uncharacterized repeat protein (TIGR01451 family)
MPTVLNNQANISYDYSGAKSSQNAVSNTVTTTLLDEYSLTANKSVLNQTFRPGNIITYILSMENNGRGDLYNLTLTDNLGSDTNVKPMSFLNAILYVNNYPVEITPVLSPDQSVTFQISSPFLSGDNAMIIYNTMVDSDLSSSVSSITNSVTVTANGGSSSGTVVTVDPNPSTTINIENYAQLSISKQSDKETITSGETLTYTFTLNNIGNEEADNIILTDTLPQNFLVTQVTSTTNGNTTTYQPDQYNLDTTTNTITLPNSIGPEIIVPASTDSSIGTTIVQIIGTVTA